MMSFLIISGILFANDKPPKEVQNSFIAKFPTVSNVKWGKENNNEWEANFKLNGIKTSANFSGEGTWLETEIEIPVSQLPEKIVSAINKDYPGYDIIGASKIENTKNETIYEADIRSFRPELFY